MGRLPKTNLGSSIAANLAVFHWLQIYPGVNVLPACAIASAKCQDDFTPVVALGFDVEPVFFMFSATVVKRSDL